MIMKRIIMAAVISCSLISCTSLVGADGPDKTNWELKTPDDAANRAIIYIPEASKSITQIAHSASLEKFTDYRIPYLRDSINNRYGWHVVIEDTLSLSNWVPPDNFDRFRKFTVSLDAQNGRLVSITYVIAEDYPDKTPTVSCDSAQEVLAFVKEVFYGLPESPPAISFTDALDHVMGSPFCAKEIRGWYLLYSRLGEEPHPVWYIDMRGVDPPYSSMSRHGANIPAKFRNNMRCVIDATTGQNVFSANYPVWSVTGGH